MGIYNKEARERGEGVNIIISNSSGKPIYEQITSQMKGMILAGELKPHDALPSMRLLAKELQDQCNHNKNVHTRILKKTGLFTRLSVRAALLRTPIMN